MVISAVGPVLSSAHDYGSFDGPSSFCYSSLFIFLVFDDPLFQFVEPSTKLVQACLTITTTPTRKNLPLTSKVKGEPPLSKGESKGNLAQGPVLLVGLPHLLLVKMLVAALGAVLIWLPWWLQQV